MYNIKTNFDRFYRICKVFFDSETDSRSNFQDYPVMPALATIYYKMIRYKQEFNLLDLKDYQQKYKQAKIAYLERKLSQLQRDVP
jgi:hypothetical protein